MGVEREERIRHGEIRTQKEGGCGPVEPFTSSIYNSLKKKDVRRGVGNWRRWENGIKE